MGLRHDSGSRPQQLWHDSTHSSRVISVGGSGVDSVGSGIGGSAFLAVVTL